MALIGNYSVLNKGPGRWLGGNSTAHASGVGQAHPYTRANWGKIGALRNFVYQDRSANALEYFSIPSGYLGRGWVMPIERGGISSHKWAIGAGTLAGAMASGKNAVSAVNGTATITATGQLVVSGSATINGAATVSGNSFAALLGTAALSASGSVTATIKALGFVGVSISGAGTCSATRYATGKLTADITPFTELSPQSLAAQILDIEDVETSMSVRNALRLIAAATAGKVSGAAGTTITIRSAYADDKDRIVATVDTAGNRSAITYDLTD
jgi:hypothetical protein